MITTKFIGMDKALLGIGSRCGLEDIAVYSLRKIREVLVGQGMSPEDAKDFSEYNIEGLGLGDNTPIILDDTGHA